jgi:hypothetical protein
MSSPFGHYLPQPAIGSNGRLDDLLGAAYTIISFDRPPHKALTRHELKAWQERESVFLWLRPDGDTVSAYQTFNHWLGDCRRRLLIVRPDRFILEDRRLPD